MLLSNDLSKPDISVPIKVTDKTPITIPNAVKTDLSLLANTADREILKFSKNKESTIYLLYLLLFFHQKDESCAWRA